MGRGLGWEWRCVGGEEVSIFICFWWYCFYVRSECGIRVGEVGFGMVMECRGEWVVFVFLGIFRLL